MSDQIQPWPLVKRGSQGHPVPALQYLLRDRGHHVTVDGIFGPKTEAAVEQFQTADQLHVDGIVGPQTWGALVIVLARGSTGDAVRGLQEEFRFRDQSGGQGHGPRGRRDLRAQDRDSGARLPAGARDHRRRDRRPADLAGPGQRHALVLIRPERAHPGSLGRGGAERAGARTAAGEDR